MPVLAQISDQFFQKNLKKQKIKKYVSICKLLCFVRVAMSTKIQESLQKTMKNTMVFGSKIDQILMKKLVVAAFTAKIEKITVVGPQLGGKTRFFANLGVPGGTQKS